MKRLVCVLCCNLFIVFFSLSYGQDQERKLSEQVEALYKSEKYVELISFCDANLPIVIQKKDSLEIAKLLFGKGKGLYHKSKHLKSIESLKQAEEYLENVSQNNALKAEILYFIHINYSIKSFILKELEYAQESLKYYESESTENKNYEKILTLYRRMANPNVTIGNYEVAIYYLDKAEELLNHIPASYKLSKQLVSYKISLGYQKVVVDLIETAFFPDNYDSLSIKKITQRVVKEKEKQDVIYSANKSLDINFHSYSSVLNFYSRYFIINQSKIDFDLSKLHEDIDKSIKLIDKRSYQRFVHLYLGNKVDVYCYEKNYNKALTLMNRIIDEAGESHNRYVNFLFQKAGILFAMGDYNQGRQWLKKSIEKIHSGTASLKPDYSNFEAGFKLEDMYLLLSVAKKIDKDLSMPQEEKNADLSLIYSLAFKQFLNTYRTQSLNKRTQNVFKTIVENLIAYNRLEKIHLSQIEHIENRIAWHRFSQSRRVVKLPVIDSLERIDFKLRKQLIAAKKQRKLKQLDSLNKALENYQKELKEAYPKLSDFTQDNFEIEALQLEMNEDEMILKYMFYKESFAVFQVTKDTAQWKLKPWNNRAKNLLENHLKQVRKPGKSLQLSDSLAQLLLPKNCFEYNLLTIIPDGPIYYLPFETLVIDNRYLVESMAIRYSSHLRLAYINKDVFNNRQTKAVVSIFAPDYSKGNNEYNTRSGLQYLDGAQKEARAIEALFTTVSFTGDEATKQQFVNHKSESTVLHMAMHATVDETNPEFSYFSFSNDEKLYLEELYGLKIPSELAVLSACNTGVGKLEASSGMVSLQRALNFSGAKATIASLWEVPDKTTSNIMISFYEQLKKGQSKSEALKNAKLEYINNHKNTKLAEPYYWGGFVLYGDDAPIVEFNNSKIWYSVLALLAVVFVGGFMIRKRKKQAA